MAPKIEKEKLWNRANNRYAEILAINSCIFYKIIADFYLSNLLNKNKPWSTSRETIFVSYYFKASKWLANLI